ncbi:MAG: type VI secretion system membrane subunit TssM [Myxococcales bacterium]|nr:type VI secretion system membrane subunit TssM [Myxococcales bacterium]
MIYVFLALLAGLAWTLWFILQLSIWVPLIVTVVLVLVAISVGGMRLLRARRGAGALERAIAEQSRQQELNARPEKRAEIQALQQQIQGGIAALKGSTLGGKAKGAAALYALPWYAIIGPPGAGKTTALKHSGLQFPYADTSVRGVGGTRNCDWWFTNEAILLDTAGRYATEHEDQSEWFAFLDMLRQHRGDKPLNGLIIAVSITDVIDASDMQLEEMARKLRARIDEVMTKLRMVLPVYFFVTKCDLLAGFNEFFGDMRKSDRQQAWGLTLALKEPKNAPGTLLAREFDDLVKRVHARAVKRLGAERNRQAREAIYQFPLELAGLKKNLQELISQVFIVNAYQGTPIFRGLYLTSGTQEGAPMSRVLERMGQAMGIRPQAIAQQARVESKSYFLYDVFTKVMFPDSQLAARSERELRRQKLMRTAVSATALAIAFAFAIPSVVSFFNNRSFLADAKATAEAASKISWESSEPIRGKLEALEPLRKQLEELDGYEKDGVPFNRRFLMYSGEEVTRPLIHVYIANLQKGFVVPVKHALEARLTKIKGERYAEERLILKTYLMSSDVKHLDVAWAAGRYTAAWAELSRALSDVDNVTLKQKMAPHVRAYFELVQPVGGGDGEPGKSRAKPVPQNDKIVEHARAALAAVPVRKRYYAMFVEQIEHELYDDSNDRVRGNLRYPSLSLDAMFADRPEVLAWLKSKKKIANLGYYEVPGPYTDKGHFAVLGNIGEATQLLEREQWVVPLSAEERGDRVAANVALLAEDYETQYSEMWKGFLADIRTKSPSTMTDALALYAEIQRPEWPFLRLLRAVEDHTQWKKSFGQLDDSKAAKLATSTASREINTKLSQRAYGLKFNVDVNKIAGRVSRVPDAFKKTVAFAVPPQGNATVTSLASYMELLGKLRDKMLKATEVNKDASVNLVVVDLNNAVKECDALLKTYDQTAQNALLPMLMLPLNVGGKIRLPATVVP